jgi:glucose-6-phosphate isomerase
MSKTSLNMDKLTACNYLQQAASEPFDLTATDSLNQARLSSYICRSVDFELFYASQRLDDQNLKCLQELAEQSGAVAQFLQMKEGKVINRIEGFPSEERVVLHTACRDIFSDAPSAPEATAQAKLEIAKLREFIRELDDGAITNDKGQTFTALINIGIGGSDLGPRAIYLALRPFCRDERRVHFISNVDPDDTAAVLKGLDLDRTLVLVVSKSGNTMETLTNEELVKSAFSRAGLDPTKHFLAVTGAGSPMDDPQKYLRSFYMFDYIGGRYSVSSMVGGVMLSFAMGVDNFRDFLHGANLMDQAAEEENIRKNIPLLLALLGIWNRNFLNCDTLAILPYSQALIRFVAHLQQCDMESNGKSINRQGQALDYQTGPIIWGEPGTNGQHAFYQSLHQGTTIVPVEFIGFRQSQYNEDMVLGETSSQEKLVANLLAQSLAMAGGKKDANPNRSFAGNRPSSLLIADQLTPKTMGQLLAIYENKIAFQGFIWNINSFDQEGVQLGKVLANRLLDLIAGKTAASPDLDQTALTMLRKTGFLKEKQP